MSLFSSNDPDVRLHAPATERNREPILQVLQRVLPTHGNVLEIACGTGQHAVFFSKHFPQLHWYPTDIEDAHLQSTMAWGRAEVDARIQTPRYLNVTQEDWGLENLELNAILCINMIHISPWSACDSLMKGAGQRLSEGGVLYLYGPYRVEGTPTAPSNEQFDASLKNRNPDWGLRWLADVEACARQYGLFLTETVQMPANNLSVIFHRRMGE